MSIFSHSTTPLCNSRQKSAIFHCSLAVYYFPYHSTQTSITIMPQYSQKRLTCRQWKLNPAGCFDGSIQCKYSHTDTGTMSPPLDVTCRSWKNGLCTLDQNYCLYTHMDTGPRQASFTFYSECTFPFFTSPIIQKREALTQ